MPKSTLTINLPDSVAKILTGVGDHLRYSGRFSLPKHLEKYVGYVVDFYSDNFAFEELRSTRYFRARVHGVNQTDSYAKTKMGAPPTGQARSGRINPDGISYLYVSDSVDTALAEVRPWKGAEISIGEFSLKKKCSVVDLSIMSGGRMHQTPSSGFKISSYLRS